MEASSARDNALRACRSRPPPPPLASSSLRMPRMNQRRRATIGTTMSRTRRQASCLNDERSTPAIARDHRSERCQHKVGHRGFFAGEQPHRSVANDAMRPPVAVDRAPERCRFESMIGKDLVQPHGEQLRGAGCLESPGGEIPEVSPFRQRGRIAEAERHAYCRHRMVMARRIADQHPPRRAVGDARPEFIGRRVEVSPPISADRNAGLNASGRTLA